MTRTHKGPVSSGRNGRSVRYNIIRFTKPILASSLRVFQKPSGMEVSFFTYKTLFSIKNLKNKFLPALYSRVNLAIAIIKNIKSKALLYKTLIIT